MKRHSDYHVTIQRRVDPIRWTRARRWRNGKIYFQNYALVKLQSVCKINAAAPIHKTGSWLNYRSGRNSVNRVISTRLLRLFSCGCCGRWRRRGWRRRGRFFACCEALRPASLTASTTTTRRHSSSPRRASLSGECQVLYDPAECSMAIKLNQVKMITAEWRRHTVTAAARGRPGSGLPLPRRFPVSWHGLVYFWNFLLDSPIVTLLRMLSSLIYNGILMLKNENKLQYFEECLPFLASKCRLTQVRLHCESNKLTYVVRMTLASR